MRFATVDESNDWVDFGQPRHQKGRVVQQIEVELEARRRKRFLDLDRWQLREFVTGAAIPEHIVHLCQQIELASAALSRMSPIPVDFADDVYWPRTW
jgi:hypothetical protein